MLKPVIKSRDEATVCRYYKAKHNHWLDKHIQTLLADRGQVNLSECVKKNGRNK